MKKIIAATGIILISCMLISSYVSAGSPKNISSGSTITEEVPITSEPVKSGYIVSVFAGKIAIYRESDKQAIFTTDCLVQDLPIEDQEKLKQGIYAPTIREADKIIATYCS